MWTLVLELQPRASFFPHDFVGLSANSFNKDPTSNKGTSMSIELIKLYPMHDGFDSMQLVFFHFYMLLNPMHNRCSLCMLGACLQTTHWPCFHWSQYLINSSPQTFFFLFFYFKIFTLFLYFLCIGSLYFYPTLCTLWHKILSLSKIFLHTISYSLRKSDTEVKAYIAIPCFPVFHSMKESWPFQSLWVSIGISAYTTLLALLQHICFWLLKFVPTATAMQDSGRCCTIIIFFYYCHFTFI